MPRISEININSQDYWDRVYANGKFPTNDVSFVERYRIAASLQVGESALDIGCGQGGLGLALGLQVTYTGVDFSQAALASTVYSAGTYHCLDWRDVETPADTVYVLELVEHVDDPAALIAKAASLARRRLVIGTPYYQRIPCSLHRGEHQWDFTLDEMAELLAPYGVVREPLPAGLSAPSGQTYPSGVQCYVVAVDR